MHDNAAEIAKIEHELEILGSRYAIFAFWAKVVKWVCTGAGLIVVALLLILGIFRDPVLAGFMALIIAAIFGTIYLVSDREFRWIDAVSPQPWPRGFGWVGGTDVQPHSAERSRRDRRHDRRTGSAPRPDQGLRLSRNAVGRLIAATSA